jgi:hypothetical protein
MRRSFPPGLPLAGLDEEDRPSTGIPPPDPDKKCIRLLGGLSSINSTPRRGTKGLMWGARGPFLPAAAMVVMVVDGSCWLLGRVSTVGIVYFFYGINLFLV